GVRTLLHAEGGGAPAAADLVVGLSSLALSVGLSVWGRGVLRWACVLIAMMAGTALAAGLGRLRLAADIDLATIPVVGLPDFGGMAFDFDLALLPAFLVAAVASSLKTVGLVTGLQRL